MERDLCCLPRLDSGDDTGTLFYKTQRSFRLSSLKLTENKNLKNREEEDEGESLDVDRTGFRQILKL